MKTSEEIKKGLKNAKHVQCMEIASDNENGGTCYGVLVGYVLRDKIFAYIQQLEARLAQVERERDAAVKDLAIDETCSNCKNDDACILVDIGHHSCSTCELDCPCAKCVAGHTQYEWRGVCEENAKEEGK